MNRASLIVLLVILFSNGLAAQQRDIVDFAVIDPTACCFDMLLINEHTPASPLDRLRLEIITPGVRFQPDAEGPWEENLENETTMVFGEGGPELPPTELLEGFTICFERFPSASREFRIVWTTEFNGQIIDSDTSVLRCEDLGNRCDSISVLPYAPPIQPEGSCCYEFTLHNVHQLPSALNGMEIRLFGTGSEIIGVRDSPWSVEAESESRVLFTADNDSLLSGQALAGFRICINSPQGPVQFIWTSYNNGRPICEGILLTECKPRVEPRCDSLYTNRLQDCSYDFGFSNLHIPESAIDGARISILTPGATIDSASAAQGWSITSQTAVNARFVTDGNVVLNGQSLDGFALHFIPPASGEFDVMFCTVLDGADVCCDTFRVACDPPPPVYCDSLLIEAVTNTCTYDLGFVNTHQPVSAVNDFHVRLQTEGASIVDAAAPDSWYIVSNDGREIVFRDTSSTVLPDEEQTGFQLSLLPGAADGRIIFEWCTSLDSSINCCSVASVFCDPPEERGDSLFLSPAEDYCSYRVGFSNLHVPVSGIDGFTITLNDAATLLRDVAAPSGWVTDTVTSTSVRFVADGSAVATGQSADGFLLHLLPSFSASRIPMTLCTEDGDSTLTCDTLSVYCAFNLVQCDEVDVTTSVEEPCCFSFEVRNDHLPSSPVDALNVELLTPEVTFYTSTVQDASGWEHISNSRRVGWSTENAAIDPGEALGGFSICYDNDATGNADFQVVVQTASGGRILCLDTLTIKCDRTLSTEQLEGGVPTRHQLHQNYPNPFNPVTTFEFDLAHPADVTLSLYDAQGRLRMDLGSGSFEAGRYRITLDASELDSGVYFYQLRTDSFVRTRTMVLMR